MRKFMRIGVGALWTVGALGLIALVAFSQQAKETAVDPAAYKEFMAAEVADIYELGSYFTEQQAFFLPLIPPAPDLLLYQPGIPGVLPFDWQNFPPDFNKGLSFEYENSVPIYPVTIVEDFTTRETIFLNAKDERIFVLSPPKDYEPFLFLRLLFPTLYSGRYSHEQLVLWQSLYDPARIRIRVRLIPLEYVEPYLYVAERLAEEAALSAASRDDGGSVLLRFGDAESNIVFVAVSHTNGGNRMVIGYPDAFTNRLDVFTCNNLTEELWTFAVRDLSTSGTNRIAWVDTNYWVASGPAIRFYAAGNADVDSDGDGFSDAAETMVYKTNPGDSNSRPVNVSGTISYTGIETGTIYILAARSADSWSIAGSVSLPGPGAWSNNVGVDQSFWFRAFRDVNANFLRDTWEPWGLYDGDSTLVTGNMTGINITLQDQPSVWGTLNYTGTVNGDIHVIAVTEPDSWDTTYGCTIGWMSEGISGEVYYVEFPVAYSITDLPASNYWLRAFVDSNTNSVMNWPELTGQYGDTAIAVSNRRTGIDFSLEAPPTVSGTISYQTYSGGQTGPIYVLAVATSNSCATNYSAVLSAPGQYQLSGLPLGYYWLRAWRDSDGNKTCGVYEARGYYTNHAILVTGQLVNVNITMTDPDTDGDGMGDWWETIHFFDPALGFPSDDLDGDNLMNLYEYYAGTDPTEGFIDTDGDGMSDDWEFWHGLNPNDPSDANLDMDQDGWTNLEEYNADTDPTAPTSHPGSCWYVATNGVDQAYGGNYTNPLASISYAMGRASSGHRIIILPGTYTGSSNRDVSFGGKNLMVTGLQGQEESTIIDCQSSGRAFLIQNGETNVVIRSLTVQNGYSGSGGAIYTESPLLVTHSIFQSNSSSYGSAIWASSTLRVEHSLLNGNGGGYQNVGSTIHSSGGHVSLLNCTIIGDRSNPYSALVRLNGNTAGFTNCILQRFGPYTQNMVTGAGTWGASHCCIDGSDPVDGVGNFVADPLFRTNNWRLMPGSPCRDSGTNLSWFGGEVDLDGIPRIQSGIVDIGAYEMGVHHVALYNPTPLPPFLSWATAATSIQDAADTAFSYSLVLVTNGVYDTGGRVVGDGVMCRVALTNVGVVVQSMNGAAATIIAGAGPRGAEAIRCVYIGSNTVLDGFTLTQGHTQESGSSLAQDGGGAWCEAGARLMNCILVQCSARFGGGIYGGSVEESIIISNSAVAGGGVYEAAITSCEISGNTAATGGGVHSGQVTTSLVLSNAASSSGGGLWGSFADRTVLKGNTAGGTGGGASESHLRSCLVVHNEAAVGGGVHSSFAENCTICDNDAVEAGGTYGGSAINTIVFYNDPDNWGSGMFTNCCTLPLADGTNNLILEPAFRDRPNGDYELHLRSPCRDKGMWQDWMHSALDLAGRQRVTQVVDIGAYECACTGLSVVTTSDPTNLWLTLSLGIPTGVVVHSIRYVGHSAAAGTYDCFPLLPSGFATPRGGVILSTGLAEDAATGSNTSSGKSTALAQEGDLDLNDMLGEATYDAAALTIEFTSDSSVEGFSFKLLFASEEFPEYVGAFNDCFGAFLNGVNITTDPETNSLSVNNNYFFLDNDPHHPDHPAKEGKMPVVLPIEYDGLTPLLVTSKSIAPGTYTLKLVIADASDAQLDSAIFLGEFRFERAGDDGTVVAEAE